VDVIVKGLRSFAMRALVLSAVWLVPAPAWAQSSVVMTVNGENVTAYDIDQRIRLARLTERRTLSRPQAIELMIDEKVKLTEARRQGLRLNDQFVEDAFARYAGNNRQSAAQFEISLRQSGIDPATVKTRIRADALWSEVIRAQSRLGSLVTTQEIEAALAEKITRGETRIVEYTLLPIIFVVTADTGGAAARERDARGLQARFTSCEDGAAAARAMRDVAVRDTMVRSSTTMNEVTRKLLEKLPIGRASAPFRTEQGIEMLAVCDRKERSDTLNARSAVEAELVEKRSGERAQVFLKELRSRAVVERR